MCQGITVKKIDIICTFIECGVRKPFVLKGLKFKNMEIKMESVKEKTMNYFTIIPSEIENDDRLTHGAKYLYGKIKALSTKEGFCWASNKYLAKITKASVSSIKRWKNILVNIGYIKSEIIYKGETKEVADRKLALTDLNRGELNLNPPLGSSWPTNNINNNNIDYKDLERKKAYARACENNELNKKEQELKNEIERLKKQLEELKSHVGENKQLKKVHQDCTHNQTYQDFEPTNQPNSQLKEEFSKMSANPTILDNSYVQPLRNKCICESAKKSEYKKSSTHQYCGQDVNGKSKSCSKSMQMYGRESFDEITTRRISNTEERVKLGKYLAFIIKRFGNITNDLWNTFLDRYLSLSNVLEKRLANLDYSFSGGYSNIFSAPKNEFRSRIQYADISIFE